MESKPEPKKLNGALVYWLSALALYLLAYGHQLFVDFMFLDDYAMLTGETNLFEVKGSGRWLLYHSLNLMSTFSDLDPNRLVLLRALSLSIQLAFFSLLYFYLLRIDLGERISLAAVLLLASLPQVQIFSVWLIALPSWGALTVMLAALVWFETAYDNDSAGVFPAWVLLVTATLATLLVNQTLYFFGAGLLTVFWMRRALYGLNWIRFAAWSLFALGTSISIYVLLLTMLGEQLGYTAAKLDYLNSILSGERAFWLELGRARPGMAFHVFNGQLSENAALIIWLPSLYLAILVVFRKTRENAAGSIAAPVIAFLYILFAITFLLLLVPNKDSHRHYFPATIVIWAFFMLALSILCKRVQYRRSEWVVILISVCSLFSASKAVDRGIIQPSLLELSFVRNSIIAADLKPLAKLYMRMPDEEWIPARARPNTGLYWFRLSSRWEWVPFGMLRYVLKEQDITNWAEIEIRFGRDETPVGFTTIDMRHLKHLLIDNGSI